MTGAKKATSIMLSAVMLMGSLLTPMTAYAQEAATEVDEVYEQPVAVTTEAIPMSPVEEPSPEPVPEAAPPEKTTEKIESKQEETEAPDYMVHLPSYMEAAWMVDESHVKKRNDDETILAYKAGDSVKISVSELEGFKLKEIKVIDGKKNEQEFTWESEGTLVFLMPEKDLNVTASFREIPEEMDPPVGAEPVTEASLTPDSAAVIDPGNIDDKPVEVPAEDPETNTGSEETGVSGQEETAAAKEPAKGTAGGQEEESKDLQIPAIDPETEADGFPVSGSIVPLAEIGIGIEAADFPAEGPFEDATYPQETCRMEMKSNTISHGVPGLYDVIYRVDESTTGKFWYVVRPVRILDVSMEADVSADNQDGGSFANDGKDREADPGDDSPLPDGETVTEAITEGNASMVEGNDPEVFSPLNTKSGFHS